MGHAFTTTKNAELTPIYSAPWVTIEILQIMLFVRTTQEDTMRDMGLIRRMKGEDCVPFRIFRSFDNLTLQLSNTFRR